MEDLRQLSEEDLLTACLWAEDGIQGGKVTVKIGNHMFLNLRG